LVTPAAAVGAPGYVPLGPPPLKLPGPRVISVVGPEGGESDIGAALAAAADRDSKLSPEVSFWDYDGSVGSVNVIVLLTGTEEESDMERWESVQRNTTIEREEKIEWRRTETNEDYKVGLQTHDKQKIEGRQRNQLARWP